MEEYTVIFQALSDQTRVRIIWLLANIQLKMCVCEIEDALGESQYKVSRHLKVLKNAGLLGEDKDGRWVFYYLKKPLNPFFQAVIWAIMAIPREIFKTEIEKCRQLLLCGKIQNCRVGVNSEEWKAALKRMIDNTGGNSNEG